MEYKIEYKRGSSSVEDKMVKTTSVNVVMSREIYIAIPRNITCLEKPRFRRVTLTPFTQQAEDEEPTSG